MGRRVILVSVVLLLAVLVAFPRSSPRSQRARPRPPRFSDPDPESDTSARCRSCRRRQPSLAPAEPLTPTILSEPPTEPTVPVPVIPS